MARVKRGRKLKQGDRHPCGKLRQAWDYGCDGVQRRREAFALRINVGGVMKVDAGHTFDAIGRAWSAGLLSVDGKDAAALRDAGRDTAALYWRHLGIGQGKDSLARFLPSHGSASDNERGLENALNRRLDAVNRLGNAVRRAFDQLAIDPYPDEGPSWLDHLIWHKRRDREPDACHAKMMALALQGLAAIA